VEPLEEERIIDYLKPIRWVVRPLSTGIIALLPIALTVAVITWLAGFIARLAGPESAVGAILKRIGWNLGSSDVDAYAGGVLITLAVVYGFGLTVEWGLKNQWERLTDFMLSRLPVIRTVYDASKKIVQMVEPRDSAEMQSMTPVMCNFGGESGTSFPAFMPTSQTVVVQGTEYHVVMIPTAPVPFGGAILCVPKERVTPLDCGIDGLFNIYMSMGTAMPAYLGVEAPRQPPTGEPASAPP
jgi:uncharacterized membrane protein